MANVVSGANVKVDYLVSPVLYAADFNDDGRVTDPDLGVWKTAFNSTAFGDADGDGDSDGADFLVWQRQLGSGVPATPTAAPVPEPTLATMLALVPLALVGLRRGNCRVTLSASV